MTTTPHAPPTQVSTATLDTLLYKRAFHRIDVAPQTGGFEPQAEHAAVHFLAARPNDLMLAQLGDDGASKHAVLICSPEGGACAPDTASNALYFQARRGRYHYLKRSQ